MITFISPSWGAGRLVRFLIAAICCTIFTSIASAGEATNIYAISMLRKAQPSVGWDSRSKVVADITCDGKSDQIFVGYGKDDSVWVGVVQHGTRPITMRFPVGLHSQNSLCAVPVRLEIYPLKCSDEEMGDLPGCEEAKGCAAISVIDDSCDSFHFYWNTSRKELVWWRR